MTIAEVSMVGYLLIKGVRTSPIDPSPPIAMNAPVGIAPANHPLVTP